MASISVTTRDGAKLQIKASPAIPLMEFLRDGSAGVEGICGGELSCGTCHIYIDAGGESLPPRSEGEQAMLDAIADFVEVRPTSRLSCQVFVDESTPDMQVTVGPVA
ncbi:ferredoxin, 2Fe-2S [Hydrocarboniphaga daqingensis]|jgi:2Fe-2S ferredoxin|uniref:Ferredoxin, 2Fe-2S n=1 Tax=Hydrocarboniphaga daqingensis TaxID=490188 RepID=A0A1M5R0Q6_9GAMM|nr:2Fe-2S iron-sulfur cluster-binding protein [Hydrocarboniphaga daqingensis]SHH19942.1 ferredoxin, 2Fe-2S [Hydrocarboniphaga daqingensis]